MLQPHGTIQQTDYDKFSRVTAQWIGTDDSGGGSDDMVKTAAMAYDGGGVGNGRLTSRTLYVVDGTTDERVTEFEHDVRGRVMLIENPTAPHVFNKYDNRGRLITAATYSSTSGIDIDTDDPTSLSTNRLTLSQTFYDERGQVWKTQRHEIASNGADSDNLQTLMWYDEVGRTMKVQGEQFIKTAYDRLGRPTHQFVLAKTDDSGYSDAQTVTGDIVLEENQTVYESTDSDDVVMNVMIERHYDDYDTGETTEPLDTNADSDDLKLTAANVEGRPRITANWYDCFGRVTDTVAFGTYGGSDFDRDGMTVPTRSDTALVTSYDYNDNGELFEVTDPKELVTHTVYDAAGRQVKVIANYDDSVNSGNPSGSADNRTIEYVYGDGLRKKIIARMPNSNDDQETVYDYGTTNGGGAGESVIATEHLLHTVTYPDTGVVTFAYNAQGQQIWTQDQAGNVIQTDYDDSGRQTHRRVTSVASGFDGAVQCISTTYDNHGRTDKITQFNDLTSVDPADIVNEVQYAYDDWGNLDTFTQDHNSAIGASGSIDDYDLTYTFVKSNPSNGRRTVRRTIAHYPDGEDLYYVYDDTNGLYDDVASRVTQFGQRFVPYVEYRYNGAGNVVGKTYLEIDVASNRHGASSSSFPGYDRFNRIVEDRWTKELGGGDQDFYNLDIAYDRNSNITLTEDNVHAGFDVAYALDDLNRLTDADEGTWNGSSITSRTRRQIWGLDQVGNWDEVKLDLDGDSSHLLTAGEYIDTREHNEVNEIIEQEWDDDDGGTPVELYDDHTHDAVGNLTDDSRNYTYVYDAFGRLRKVQDRAGTPNLLAEYTYNGLGHRITAHYDVNASGGVDGSDPHFAVVGASVGIKLLGKLGDEQVTYPNLAFDLSPGQQPRIRLVALRRAVDSKVQSATLHDDKRSIWASG